MKKDNLIEWPLPSEAAAAVRSVLDEIVREGARKMLQQAIEGEVAEYLALHQGQRDQSGRRLVVRHGHLPTRSLVTGVGPVEVTSPRVRHREGQSRFTSAILPPYLRRVPCVEALIPALYLKGISSGDFEEALCAILGPGAVGLSATNIVRLKAVWEDEYQEWRRRDLSGKRYVYIWVDGVYFNVRAQDERLCILVVMGALEDGRKELIAVADGYRESKLSWQELLGDLKARGLNQAPRLAIGDGALGFWAALEEEYGSVSHQRCWVHKTANVLDKMPQSVQASAKSLLHEMYLAATLTDALSSYEKFFRLYGAKYPKACACLAKDKEVLFTFYEFPAEHWSHIRSTNPIESTFATVRHRTRRSKGSSNRTSTLTMVFKLGLAAQKKWRRINAPTILGKIISGVRFVDGVEATGQELQQKMAA